MTFTLIVIDMKKMQKLFRRNCISIRFNALIALFEAAKFHNNNTFTPSSPVFLKEGKERIWKEKKEGVFSSF